MPVRCSTTPRPVMRARARFHTDAATRQRGHELMQPGTRHARSNEHRLAVLVDPVDREYALGEIDPDVENAPDFLLPSELMDFALPIVALRCLAPLRGYLGTGKSLPCVRALE